MATSKEYSNGEVTIIWKPDLCIHSANCVRGLSGVFDTQKRPWINAEGASTDRIVDQVKKCPSGALSTIMNTNTEKTNSTAQTKITITENGPVIIEGQFEVVDAKGKLLESGGKTAFCRCGGSGNKPFCDGTHRKIEFKG